MILGPQLLRPQVCITHGQSLRSVLVDVHYTASAGQSSTGPTSNSTSFTSSAHGPSPFQDHNGEDGMGSEHQVELSRYKRLYSQAREDLNNLKGQSKRRSIQTIPPVICAYGNKLLGKLLAGHNWDVAYANLSPFLMIYQLSSTSMIYSASYVRA
jgi:hypothetical protein